MPYHWVLAALVAVVLGGAANAWLWLQRRRRDEASAGLSALGAMRWREFSRFVLDAMRHRGHDVETDGQALAGVALAGAEQTDFVLHRGERRTLLACRHGGGARVDMRLVHGLENAILANGAGGAVLVTTGTVEPEARRAIARQPKIELLAGGRLWRELKPLLPETVRDEASAGARHQARGRIRLAWLGALAIGVVVLLVAGRSVAPPQDELLAVAPKPAAPAPATPAAPAATEAPAASPPAEPDPEEDAFDRSQVALAIAALPGVSDAAWVTESTLLVNLRSDANDSLPDICELLEQYATLRTARLQLQPPPGSGQPVRFRQCRVF